MKRWLLEAFQVQVYTYEKWKGLKMKQIQSSSLGTFGSLALFMLHNFLIKNWLALQFFPPTHTSFFFFFYILEFPFSRSSVHTPYVASFCSPVLSAGGHCVVLEECCWTVNKGLWGLRNIFSNWCFIKQEIKRFSYFKNSGLLECCYTWIVLHSRIN